MPEPIETPPAPETPPVVPPQTAPSDEPKLFTQADLNAKLAKERKETEQKVKDNLAAEQARKQAETDQERLKEQGEWQRVAEQKDEELSTLRRTIEQKELDALRIEVGDAHKLPRSVSLRLIGSNKDELNADAAKLAKDIPPAVPGNTQNGGPYTPPTDKKTLTEPTAQQRQAAVQETAARF